MDPYRVGLKFHVTRDLTFQFSWTTANGTAPYCAISPHTMVNQVNHNLVAFRKFEDADDYYLKGAIDELLILEQALPEDLAAQLYY